MSKHLKELPQQIPKSVCTDDDLVGGATQLPVGQQPHPPLVPKVIFLLLFIDSIAEIAPYSVLTIELDRFV